MARPGGSTRTTRACGCPGRTPRVAATSRMPCSATRTATAGCSSRSRPGCRDADVPLPVPAAMLSGRGRRQGRPWRDQPETQGETGDGPGTTTGARRPEHDQAPCRHRTTEAAHVRHGCHRPGRRGRLPPRAPPGAAELGRTGPRPPRRLPRGGRRRPRRRMAGAGRLHHRGPGCVQVAAPGRDVMTSTVETATGIRPFHVDIPEEALTDLRRRIAATQWPERETVADQSQGVPLEMMQELAHYWATGYDWRHCETALNALPQFIAEIDGLDIHFIHARSRHEDALPLVVNHGWPGSIIEQLKIIDRLTDPPAHGGTAEDAFHVVIPSMPGYGFSGKPTTTGWGPERMARAWAQLMRRLGYTRYVAQGGDWGAFVVD